MQPYFAIVILGTYGFDLAVWLMIGVIFLLGLIAAAFTKGKGLVYFFSTILLLTSVPAAATTEVSSHGQDGVGYIFGVLVAMVSVAMMIFAKNTSSE